MKNGPASGCTAFDHARQLASGSYLHVAVSVKEHIRTKADAAVLIFDDATGKQIDFDLRGTDRDIEARLQKQFPSLGGDKPRSVGRPKLGVVSREITLLPRHWDWLAEQPGGASVALRKLVEDASRSGLDDKARRRKAHERTYHFVSAIAGNLANFEEALRALFADDSRAFKKHTAGWPSDIRKHVLRLNADAPAAETDKS